MTQTAAVQPRNNLALASMCLGIAAIVTTVIVIGGLLGVVALVLGIIAIRRPGGHGMSVAGIVTGALSIVMAMFFALMIAILLPALSKARMAANEVRTMANMRQLGMGLMMYSQENRGYLPADLADIGSFTTNRGELLLDTRVHTTATALPSGTDWAANPAQVAAHCDFYYVGAGLKLSHLRSSPATIVLYDKPQPKGRRLILFADGHAERLQVGSVQLNHDVQVTNTARQEADLPAIPVDLSTP